VYKRQGWIPSNPVKIEDENIKKELEALYDDLDEQQDVNEIYDNTGD